MTSTSPPAKKRGLDQTTLDAIKAVTVPSATHLISVDVETSGPNVVTNFMPEFAATLIKVGERTPMRTFYRSLAQPDNTGWNEQTLAKFWDNPKEGKDGVAPIVEFRARRAEHPGEPLKDAMNDFIDWLALCREEVAAVNGTVIIVTDTAGFDVKWIDTYLSHYCTKGVASLDEALGFYQPTRDISSFMLGVGMKLKPRKSLETALEGLGLTADKNWGEAYAHNHDPQSDANHIAATASFIVSRVQ